MFNVEYLGKQWIQTRFTETRFEVEYRKTIAGIRKYLLGMSKPNGFLFIGERTGNLETGSWSTKMDHLVCFMPGTMALVASRGKRIVDRSKMSPVDRHDLELAEELVRSCYEMYHQTLTGLSPEIVFWNEFNSPESKSRVENILQYHQTTDPSRYEAYRGNIKAVPENGETDLKTRFGVLDAARQEVDFDIHPLDGHNLLRPETVESLMILYKVTGKEIYRDWGWKMFNAFRRFTKVPAGFTSIVMGLM